MITQRWIQNKNIHQLGPKEEAKDESEVEQVGHDGELLGQLGGQDVCWSSCWLDGRDGQNGQDGKMECVQELVELEPWTSKELDNVVMVQTAVMDMVMNPDKHHAILMSAQVCIYISSSLCSIFVFSL